MAASALRCHFGGVIRRRKWRVPIILTQRRIVARRVFITGPLGAGKTTLARIVAERLHAVAFHLDLVASRDGTGSPLGVDRLMAYAHRVASQDSWVVEGIYVGWTEAFLRRADLLVMLDPPWRLAVKRLLKRELALLLKGAHPARLPKLFFQLQRYYRNRLDASVDEAGIPRTRATVVSALAPFWGKVLQCKSPRDVRECLRAIAAPRPDPPRWFRNDRQC